MADGKGKAVDKGKEVGKDKAIGKCSESKTPTQTPTRAHPARDRHRLQRAQI